MNKEQTQGAPCTAQTEPERDRRNAKDHRRVRCRQALEDRQTKCFLMNLGQQMPGTVQINPAQDQVLVRAAVRLNRCIGEADPKGVPALGTTLRVQQEVPGDTESPCPSVVVILRHVIEPSPEDKERLSHYVFG